MFICVAHAIRFGRQIPKNIYYKLFICKLHNKYIPINFFLFFKLKRKLNYSISKKYI